MTAGDEATKRTGYIYILIVPLQSLTAMCNIPVDVLSLFVLALGSFSVFNLAYIIEQVI